MKKIILTIMIVLGGVGLLVPPLPVSAQTNLAEQINDQLNAGAEQTELPKNDRDPRVVIALTIKVVLELLGTVFLLLTLYGGFLYFSARGDEGQVEKAKQTLTAAVIGLVIVIASYSITLFVAEKLAAAVTKNATTEYGVPQAR